MKLQNFFLSKINSIFLHYSRTDCMIRWDEWSINVRLVRVQADTVRFAKVFASTFIVGENF